MSPNTNLRINAPKRSDRASVVFIKELLEDAQSDVDAWGADGVRALVRRALAGETDGSQPLRVSVSDDGTLWAYDEGAGAVKIGTWTQEAQVSYRLVDVIDQEVTDPAERPARFAVVRDGLWDLVTAGTFGSYDEALIAYRLGEVEIGADDFSDATTTPPHIDGDPEPRTDHSNLTLVTFGFVSRKVHRANGTGDSPACMPYGGNGSRDNTDARWAATDRDVDCRTCLASR